MLLGNWELSWAAPQYLPFITDLSSLLVENGGLKEGNNNDYKENSFSEFWYFLQLGLGSSR